MDEALKSSSFEQAPINDRVMESVRLDDTSKPSLAPDMTQACTRNDSKETMAVNDGCVQFGFAKVKEQLIEDYNSNAVLYRHTKSGAEVMSIKNDDENKAFAIVFRTLPKDSTGVAHILEHSVLCGSSKYPLKEPFVELLKGSFHTYLNAWTYPDKTCYPVASTNTKDFYNLINVYLDAVFFPKCVEDEHIFKQEGWHYELNDPSEEITLKGVVLSEMKGSYSRPDNLLHRFCQHALFPDNSYAVDSGGDPSDIPKLKFSEFQEFHKTFYHPSNARIWFYGDDDPNRRLCLLNAYLEKFEANNAARQSEVKVQKCFSGPKTIVKKYPASDIKKKHIVCVNWLLSDEPLDRETEFALEFLDHLLLGTPAAPLRMTLLDSGLGEALVGGGFDDHLRQVQFRVGLKNVLEEDVTQVEDLIITKLNELVVEGFTPEAVEASMNSVEFSLRENNTGGFPRGLSLMLRSMSKWLHGLDPFEPLMFTKSLENLKARIISEGATAVLSPLIQKYLLDNPHKVTVLLQPDVEIGVISEKEEKENLRKYKESLTEEDLAELVRTTKYLRLRQETPDPPEVLAAVPCLSFKDIPKEPTVVPLDVGEIQGTTVLRHDLFTNGVLYADLAFDMTSVDVKHLPLVPLFCKSMMEMGTRDMDFARLNQLIHRKTGGIWVFPRTSARRETKEPCSHLMVRGKAVGSQVQELFNLMRVVLQDVQFTDQKRFKQLLLQSKAGMESALKGSGQSIAFYRLNAKMNSAGWVSEQMRGLSYFDYLQELEKQIDCDWPTIAESLLQIRNSSLSRKGVLVNLTGDSDLISKAEIHVASLLQALPESVVTPDLTPKSILTAWNDCLDPTNEGFIIPTKVNYVGKALDLYSIGYKLNGSVNVICKHFRNTWLWDQVRVSGGAYGGSCHFDQHSGVLCFLSYRDPNLLETLDIFDNTTKFLQQLELDTDSLTRAIIGAIGDMDAYELPDAKGYTSMLRHLLGITEEERKQRRQEVLSTRLDDFKAFANVLEAGKVKSVIVVVASESSILSAKKTNPGLLNVRKAL